MLENSPFRLQRDDVEDLFPISMPQAAVSGIGLVRVLSLLLIWDAARLTPGCEGGAERTIPFVTGPSQRREMAATTVARPGVSIAPACRAFGVSKTRCRYGPKSRAENKEIADLLAGPG